MVRKAKEMSAMEVSKLAKPGFHAVGVVPGLYLQVPRNAPGATVIRTARTWVLRTVIAGKRRDMGLGGFPEVTLAKARDDARKLRDQIRAGNDPIEQRREATSRLKADRASAVTFQQAAEAYMKAHAAGWRNDKHKQQWRNTLEQYAFPVIGTMLVRDVALSHVLHILEPIWTTKTETASRLRGRIESVLDWAKGRGYRSGDNPAAWKGNLDAQLPRPEKVSRVEHHTALPVGEMGAFMARLRSAEGMGARALEFAILTAARSGEVRGATWSELDLDAGVWMVPGQRMKAGKEHRVPLSKTALKLLEAIPRTAGSDYVFPAPRGGQLSDMTLTAVLRRMEIDAVPHGFRSTFRDWVSERTSYPGDMAEMALAHTIGDKVEAAYRRGDMFEKRRKMMDDWARFCGQPEVAKVVSLNPRKKA